MSRHRTAMIAVGVLTAGGSALLLWRGEGLAAPLLLVVLAVVVLLELDARRGAAQARAEIRQLRATVARLTTRLDEPPATLATVRELDGAVERVAQDVARVREDDEEAGRRHERLERRMRALATDSVNQVQALLQLQQMFAPTAPLPRVDGWAMEPTTLLTLVDLVARHRPARVVECGSGTSTVWLAHAVRRIGRGSVVALEHDDGYAERTRRLLDDHQLGDRASVVHAPLAPVETPRGAMPWYSVDPATLGTIDLLVVDGPPGATGELARYPALPVLSTHLAPGARILLDDAHRPDETAAVDAWRQSWPVTVERELAGRALLLRFDQGAGGR